MKNLQHHKIKSINHNLRLKNNDDEMINYTFLVLSQMKAQQ